ncbi:MAG: hypothetical protein QM726_15970 [Chitinophagaceae bacterium]
MTNYFRLLLGAILLISIMSCKQSIQLEKIHETSNLLSSPIQFGKSLNSFKYENEFILQIGIIDTTDEVPAVKAAIVKIKGKQIVLHLVALKLVDKRNIEDYSGGGFNLSVSYKEEFDPTLNETFYQGSLIIQQGDLKSEYEIAGMKNRL